MLENRKLISYKINSNKKQLYLINREGRAAYKEKQTLYRINYLIHSLEKTIIANINLVEVKLLLLSENTKNVLKINLDYYSDIVNGLIEVDPAMLSIISNSLARYTNTLKIIHHSLIFDKLITSTTKLEFMKTLDLLNDIKIYFNYLIEKEKLTKKIN